VTRPAPADEHGGTMLQLPLLVWVVTLATVAVVDVTAYLVAASRAQTLADAAALAAVSADAEVVPADGPTLAAGPRGRAVAVVDAGGGELLACVCGAGTGRSQVAVRVAVPGLVVPRLGAGQVRATAEAVVVDDPPGLPWP
jgi:hypothetical protein